MCEEVEFTMTPQAIAFQIVFKNKENIIGFGALLEQTFYAFERNS